jgi:hypothetical protein
VKLLICFLANTRLDLVLKKRDSSEASFLEGDRASGRYEKIGPFGKNDYVFRS